MDSKASPYALIRSHRKTLALEITRDLRVVVRAPARMPIREIDRFVLSHQQWIAVHMEKQRKRAMARPEPSEAEIPLLKARAHQYIPLRVAHYAALMGLVPATIKITSAHHRFGSCSWKNNLCFSYRLMLYPPEAIDYVVVHELAHIIHKNHSPAFYLLIEQYLPDWQARQALLRE